MALVTYIDAVTHIEDTRQLSCGFCILNVPEGS